MVVLNTAHGELAEPIPYRGALPVQCAGWSLTDVERLHRSGTKVPFYRVRYEYLRPPSRMKMEHHFEGPSLGEIARVAYEALTPISVGYEEPLDF